ELHRGIDFPAAQVRPVLAAEIFQDRSRVGDHDSSMLARHQWFVDTDDGVLIAPEKVLAGAERDLAVSPDESVDRFPTPGNGFPKFVRRSAEGVTEPRHRADDAGLV